jgi:hypothetical protein
MFRLYMDRIRRTALRRQIGKVGSSTHLGGKGVNQELTGFVSSTTLACIRCE